MAKVFPLFSSSEGNCTYISCGDDAILIDVGKSVKQISETLTNNNFDLSNIKAIFITHEHSDHICGLKVLLHRIEIPVYATVDTIEYIKAHKCIENNDVLNIIDSEGVRIGDMLITPFLTSHDCARSCGYTIDASQGIRISVCTDLGYVSDNVRNALIGSDMVLLEANYDPDMLKTGVYPPHLKKRIAGLCGHLSNDAAADLAVYLAQNGTTRFILSHISKENNTPQLAEQAVKKALNSVGLIENMDYIVKASLPSGNPIYYL